MPTKLHSDHRAIVRGMFMVTALVLLGSVARAGREMAIAYRYGISAEVDAYLFVFNLVNWPVSVWFSVLTVVLVPLAARIKQTTPFDFPAFRAELFALALVLGIVLALACLWLLPVLLRTNFTGLANGMTQKAVGMVAPLSLLVTFGILVGLFSALTMVAGRHVNTLLEGLPSVCILGAVLMVTTDSTDPLILGTVAGFAIHALALWAILARGRDIERPQLHMRSPHWPGFFQGFGIVLAGQILMALTTLVDQFFAGTLGPGSISTLNYASRILALIMGVGAMAVSRAMLPIFSLSQGTESAHASNLARKWLPGLFGLGLATVAVTWIAAPWIVKLFFERGAFKAQDSAAVVGVFRLCLIQVPFYFSCAVLTSYFSSQGKYQVLFWSSVAALGIKTVASWIFTRWWGLAGLPLASAAMYCTTFTFLVLVFWRLTRKPKQQQPLKLS